MKYYGLILLSFALLLSSGCKSQQPVTSSTIWNNKDINVIDETFSGKLPCADCEQIDYVLTLKPDMTWHSRMIYVGKSVKAFEESGHYNVSEEGIVFLGTVDNGLRFREVSQGLLMLDSEGNKIGGTTADYYILIPKATVKKSQIKSHGDTISDKRLNNIWVMIQLGDSILNPNNFMNGLPRIELSVKRHEISGHDGCNRIRGTFSTKGNSIKFNELITTKIACPHKKWSEEITPALSGCAYRYSFGKNRLILKKDNKIVIVLKKID
jgi:uncharacterized lipoprotein NlpE involved in copper resistance